MVVTLGEIMLRLKAPHRERFFQSPYFETSFAGGEANVAVALSHLGIPTRFASVLPDSPLASGALAYLKKDNVDVSFVVRGPGRMGIYFLEEGAAQRPNKVLYDREISAMSQADEKAWDWQALFEGQKWFHISGLTPALSASARQVALRAVEEATKRGIPVSLDLNYRRNLWKYGVTAEQVMPEIVRKVQVLVADETDTQMALGVKLESHLDVHRGEIDYEAYRILGQQVLSAYPNLKSFAITLRESLNADHNRWSALLFEGREEFHSHVYDIYPIVEQTGAGDAFCAGLIYGKLQRKLPQDTLEFATALSCLKHSLPGDQARLGVDEVEAVASGLESGRVDR